MPTQSVFANLSGTTWTLNVTAANLVADTAIKDFEVYFNSVLQSNVSFTKLTATSIQYNGAAMNALVEVRRYTDAVPFHLVTYRSPILSGDYNSNLEKISRKLEEIEAFPPGFASVPQILSGAYGASWAADTINAPSRSAVYAEIQSVKGAYAAADVVLQSDINTKAPLASPALTGTPTAPTPPNGDNTTKLSTTQFVNASLIPYATSASVIAALAPYATTSSVTALFNVNKTPRLVSSHSFSGSTALLNITGLSGTHFQFVLKAGQIGSLPPTVSNPFYYMRLNGVTASQTYVGEGFYVASTATFDPNGSILLGNRGNIILEADVSSVSTMCQGTIIYNSSDNLWFVYTQSQRHRALVTLNELVIRTYAATGSGTIGTNLTSLEIGAWNNGAAQNVPAGSTFELWLLG